MILKNILLINRSQFATHTNGLNHTNGPGLNDFSQRKEHNQYSFIDGGQRH